MGWGVKECCYDSKTAWLLGHMRLHNLPQKLALWGWTSWAGLVILGMNQWSSPSHDDSNNFKSQSQKKNQKTKNKPSTKHKPQNNFFVCVYLHLQIIHAAKPFMQKEEIAKMPSCSKKIGSPWSRLLFPGRIFLSNAGSIEEVFKILVGRPSKIS